MSGWDVVVLGAGAAGLYAGAEAARRGRRTLVLDHAKRAGEKIRISGGGRCNVTNLNVSRATIPERFLSANPRFALSALSRHTARDFLARFEAAGLTWSEKALGQLFCATSAKDVVAWLVRDLEEAGASLRLGVSVQGVDGTGPFTIRTDAGDVIAAQEGALRHVVTPPMPEMGRPAVCGSRAISATMFIAIGFTAGPQ